MGAAYLPAETIDSQPFWFCFRGIPGNDGVGGEGEEPLGLKPEGWGKAAWHVSAFSDRWYSRFPPSPFAMGEEKQGKGNISQHQVGPAFEKKRYGKCWRKEKFCFSDEQSLEGVRTVLGKIKLIYTNTLPREDPRWAQSEVLTRSAGGTGTRWLPVVCCVTAALPFRTGPRAENVEL